MSRKPSPEGNRNKMPASSRRRRAGRAGLDFWPLIPGVEPLEDRLLLSIFTVTSLADTGSGTLRTGIAQASSPGATTTIEFAPGLSGTIALASPLAITDGTVVIQGPGENSIAISNQHDTGIFNVTGGGDLASIRNLTLVDSNLTDVHAPGAITAAATSGTPASQPLVVSDVRFQTLGTPPNAGDIHDSINVEAGSIYNLVSISASTFLGNSPPATTIGTHAVEIAGASLTVFASTFEDYSIALLFDASATGAAVSSSTFIGCFTNGFGSAINATGLSMPMTILADTFTNNRSSGGVISAGTAGNAVIVEDSIVYGNTSTTTPILNGTFTSFGYNDIQNNSDDGTTYSGFVGGAQPTDMQGVNPLLAGLGDYGGPTPTDGLEPGSPALTKGKPGAVSTDQRGVTRSATAPSIGAFEGSGVLFTVTSTGDNGGVDPAPDSTYNNLSGTLRQGIVDANAFHPGTTAIQFAIPGASGTPQTISLANTLDAINANVVIDGSTQAGYSNTPLVRVEGSGFATIGLTVGAGGQGEILDLNFDRFTTDGIRDLSALPLLIAGNVIGPDSTFASPQAVDIGVYLQGASNVTIGGTSEDDRNLIAGNTLYDVFIDATSTGDVVEGNYLATNATGTAEVAGTENEVIEVYGTGITIGGTGVGAGNVVGGPLVAGSASAIDLQGSSNIVEGNNIGIGIDGNSLLPVNNGVSSEGVSNTIGAAGAGNLIEDARVDGIYVNTGATGQATQTVIQGNTIRGSTFEGIGAFSTASVGGAAAGQGNTIFGNVQGGLDLEGASASNSVVYGNTFGDVNSGITADGPFQVKVANLASGVTIGGTGAGQSNVVVGDTNGIGILLDDVSNTVVAGDLIGVTQALQAMRNFEGIVIQDGSSGTVVSQSTISGSTTNFGVEIKHSTATSLQGNLIGLILGSPGSQNMVGITIDAGSTMNTIGGATVAARNLISGNTAEGVEITDVGTTGNVVEGNYIGTKANGTDALGNGTGVYILAGAASNTIGGATATPGAGAGNVIGGNAQYGVYIVGTNTDDNVVEGNVIGEVAGGTAGVAGDVAWYKFDDTAQDYAGAHPATIVGTSAYLTGEVAQGLSLDGSGEVTTPLTVSYATGATFDLWFQTTAASGTLAADGGGFAGQKGMSLTIQGGKVVLQGSNGTASLNFSIFSPSAYNDGNFHHVAATWTGDTTAGGVNLYVDGVLVGTATAALAFATGSQHFEMGGHDVLAYPKFVGVIDEANVFSRPLTAAEVARIFSQGGDGQGLGNRIDGIRINGGASFNTVGGSAATARNVIGGNFESGVFLLDVTTVGNAIQGNSIGTDLAGESVVSDGSYEIFDDGSSSTLIGGPTDDGHGHPAPGSAPGNLIAGAYGNLGLFGSFGVVSGNIIGEDAAGARRIIPGGAAGNVLESISEMVGGPIPSDRNIVGGAGFFVSGGAAHNAFENNYIGTDITGTIGVGIDSYAFYIYVAGAGNAVGAPNAGNVISDDSTYVFFVSGAPGLIIQGNEIGTNAAGTAALPNAEGLQIANADGLQIGGTAPGAGNLISGNGQFGISIGYTTGGTIQGNKFGTDVTGTYAIPNAPGSVALLLQRSVSGFTVGGTTAAARNVISGNGGVGIETDGYGVVGNLVEGNYIGVNAAGTAALPNAGDGINIAGSALDNTIGGIASVAGNVISASGGAGIDIDGTGTPDLTIAYFKADGNANNAANSSVGTATLVGGVNYGPGITGQAFQFHATPGERVVATNDPNNYFGMTVLTFSAWINLNSLPGATPYVVASKSYSPTSENYGLYVNSGGELVLEWYSAGSFHTLASTGAALGTRLGTFQQVAIVVSGTTASFYVNGSAVGSSAMPAPFDYTQAGSLEIGGLSQGPNVFNGRIDELSFQDNALAADEIARIYANAGAGIDLGGSGTERTVVQGNFIGTDATGTIALANATDGVLVNGALNNSIGGNAAGSGNLIGGNVSAGVLITGVHAVGNVVAGDKIGTDFSGLAPVATSNTVAWYRAEGNANDSAGPNTATIVGNVTYGPGQEGQAFQFDGSSYVQSPLVDHDSAGITFDVWINTTQLGNPVIMDDGGGTTVDSGMDISLGNGVAQVYGSHGVNGQSNFLLSDNASPGINDGHWHHITATWTGDTTANGVKLYVDGILVVQGTALSAIATGTDPLVIGGSGLHAYQRFAGSIDEAAIFNRVLTPQEIAQIQSAGGHGVALTNHDGVDVTAAASGNTIGGAVAADRNLISGNAVEGIMLTGVGTTGNVVEGDFVGTDKAGAAAFGNGNVGVVIVSGASGNTIGGLASTPGTGPGNVISGNATHGVDISQAGAINNVVEGNLIGTDATGMFALGNLADGVILDIGPSHTTIGGTVAGAGNVISGNRNGVDTVLASSNLIAGNIIGLNISGNAAIPNSLAGILENDASNDTIGGTTAAARNIISGNITDGVEMGFSCLVEGNYIGTDITGEIALVNHNNALSGVGATNVTIGGTAAGAGNVIDGANYDIYISSGATGALIQGNLIGLDASGTEVLFVPNEGIQTNDPGATIGGTTAAARNVIAGARVAEIIFGASNTTVEGNYIGTNITGTVALGTGTGVDITGGSGSEIGGTVAGAGNVISVNAGTGVIIQGATATGNFVQGNLIGTDPTGKFAVGGQVDGLVIAVGATNNTIGGTNSVARNVISGNTSMGILITGTGTTGNVIEGNYVGTDMSGTLALPNVRDGIEITAGASANLIGGLTAVPGTGPGNLISGNNITSSTETDGSGVLIDGVGTTGNVVEGNLLGTNDLGSGALGNYRGVVITAGASGNTVGGIVAGSRNVLSGNVAQGVWVTFAGTSLNTIDGNFIGTDLTGSVALGNGNNGIEIDGTSAMIGGVVAGAGNVIVASGLDGIFIFAAPGVVVQGNYIGTNSAGQAGLGNAGRGIMIEFDSPSTVIGGVNELNPDGTVKVLHGNVIASNSITGIEDDSTAGGLLAEGNFIGTDPTGNIRMGSGFYGIFIEGSNNTIGGTTPGAGNLISGNAQVQIFISGNNVPANDNLVEGNMLGTNYAGTVAITETAAGGTGVDIFKSDGNTIGGTAPGSGNLISGHGQWGVEILSGSTGNLVEGNEIGTNLAGTAALPNGALVNPGDPSGGVDIDTSAGNTIGGTIAGAANVISGNANAGLQISGVGATGNVVEGDYFGIDATSTYLIADNATNNTGILIENGASSNTIGGTSAGARDYIDSSVYGIDLETATTTSNVIEGDYIGLRPDGTHRRQCLRHHHQFRESDAHRRPAPVGAEQHLRQPDRRLLPDGRHQPARRGLRRDRSHGHDRRGQHGRHLPLLRGGRVDGDHRRADPDPRHRRRQRHQRQHYGQHRHPRRRAQGDRGQHHRPERRRNRRARRRHHGRHLCLRKHHPDHDRRGRRRREEHHLRQLRRRDQARRQCLRAGLEPRHPGQLHRDRHHRHHRPGEWRQWDHGHRFERQHDRRHNGRGREHLDLHGATASTALHHGQRLVGQLHLVENSLIGTNLAGLAAVARLASRSTTTPRATRSAEPRPWLET